MRVIVYERKEGNYKDALRKDDNVLDQFHFIELFVSSLKHRNDNIWRRSPMLGYAAFCKNAIS